ncbi:MAG TPA: ester cyclase [Miltoncostaeaceae bacterium]|nr:ester cyclase [Miltoncostaeaceae bacterium]
MSEALELGRRYAREVWMGRRMDVIDELFAADHVYHDALLPDLPRGPEGVRRRVEAYLGAVPDARLREEAWVADGDQAVLRWTWGGTNTGELMGMPATGRRAETTGMHMVRVQDGRIAETWVSFDAVGFMQQLGVIAIGPQEAVAG